jgi:hypothetical protein
MIIFISNPSYLIINETNAPLQYRFLLKNQPTW